MNAYEILIRDEGQWKRIAFLPTSVGWPLTSVIAEEVSLAWGFPVRVVRGSEMILELGAPAPTRQVA